MSARPGPRGGYHVSGIPTAISLRGFECNGDLSPTTQKKPVYSDTRSPMQTPGRFVDLVVVTAQAVMRVTAKAPSDTAFRVSTRNNLT